MRDVAGKVAVVTGGANGIGLAMAQRFGQAGMKVVIADILQASLDEAEALLREQGLDVTGVQTDVTKLASVEALAQATLDTYGAVHVLCNNAGIGPGGQLAVWEYEPSDWRWCIDVNLFGVAWGMRTFLPLMIASGEECHVVNTSSGNGGLVPVEGTPIYSMTKAGVTTITEMLYLNLRERGLPIGCSLLFPGPKMLRTKLYEAWKTRPDEYARTGERPPHMTLADFEERMRAAGMDIEFTPLEEVAERVLDGILADRFWILPPSEHGDEAIQKRTAAIVDRRNPDYFRSFAEPQKSWD